MIDLQCCAINVDQLTAEEIADLQNPRGVLSDCYILRRMDADLPNVVVNTSGNGAEQFPNFAKIVEQARLAGYLYILISQDF